MNFEIPQPNSPRPIQVPKQPTVPGTPGGDPNIPRIIPGPKPGKDRDIPPPKKKKEKRLPVRR